MNVGFDTIGNATIICYDRGPILVTDPWLTGSAYFGSWTFSHEIPVEQMEAARQCQFVWVSHGHPDHLSPDSLELLRGKTILLPDHRGNRIRDDLQVLGFKTQVLQNRVWTKLSDRIRVLCIADYNQDGILLIDINGRLLVNLNDAGDRGWSSFVRGIVRRYDRSFLLKLGGFGDADMINFFDESGNRIPVLKKDSVGEAMAIEASTYGTRYVVPFSSMHRYQRSDSIWAEQYVTQVSDYSVGFDSKLSEMLPAFIRYDCEKDRLEEIRPEEKIVKVHTPEEFGDKWNDQLEKSEVGQLSQYFKSISHLRERFDFMRFRVGGSDHVIELARNRFNRGITFEVPRSSLMTAVQYEVFDDLLIGNFMKTTLHGKFDEGRLYPDFTPYVAKYSDNGKAKTKAELEAYFESYRKQAPYDYFRHVIESSCRRAVLMMGGPETALYRVAAKTYHYVKSL